MCLFKLYALSKFESFLREMAILRSYYTYILIIAQLPTTLLALEVRQKKYQFVLFSSICITNSFRSNPRCS